MARYTTPFNVWRRLGRVNKHQTSVNTLETGDTVQLESHVITDKVILRDEDGNEIPDTDFEVDEDYDELTYTGTSTENNVRIRYMTAPVADDRAKRGVEQAESHVDNHLNTTFGGLKRRVDEVYKTDGGMATKVMLQQQPVVNVEKVEFNTKMRDDTPANWEELEEGVDWRQQGKTGFKLTSNVRVLATTYGYTTIQSQEPALSNSQYQLRVTYTYGYEEVPADIQNLAEIFLSTDFFIDTVFGAGVDGRDNFDPQTIRAYQDKVGRIKEEWRREYYNNFSTMVKPGTEEDVT